MAFLDGGGPGLLPFAPPFVKVGGQVLAQTAHILAALAPRLGLAPGDDAGRLSANQLQLTIADVVAETHDLHHPVGVQLYYEDQRREAKRKAPAFREERVPRFLGYFEQVLERNRAGRGRFLVGQRLSYVDLSLFQLVAGLRYALPNTMAALEEELPRVVALAAHVEALPRIAAYLASPRRQPFNTAGIFRHYPELDAQAPERGARKR
jgi:glutathione S-transferase